MLKIVYCEKCRRGYVLDLENSVWRCENCGSENVVMPWRKDNVKENMEYITNALKSVIEDLKKSEGERFRCPFCDYEVSSFNHMKRHFKHTHSNGFCPACGKPVRNSTLIHHAIYVAMSEKDVMHILIMGLWNLSKCRKSKFSKLAREFTYYYLLRR